MNVHHLELFYHVARHHGISSAARRMPYGIQQPAMSSQICQLERDLGTRLFERSPFRLTRSGAELFDFIRPFFGNLDRIAARLGQDSQPILRIAAAELMLRDYLPAVVRQLRAAYPDLQLGLRSGYTRELEAALREHEIDLAIVPQDGKPAPGFRRLGLLKLPLVLVVPVDAPVKSAAELWALPRIDAPLISLPEHEVISRIFKRGLKRLWVEWPCAIEASSLDLIPRYVANGYGYGVSAQAGSGALPPNVRALPLDGFDPVEIAILWQGKTTPLIQAILGAAKQFVAENWPEAVLPAPAPKPDPRRRAAVR